MDSSKIDYHVKEYMSLREEVVGKLQEMDNAFRFTLTAASVLSAWILSQSPTSSDKAITLVVAAWIPLIVTLLLGVHYNQLRKSVRIIATYLKRLEGELACPDFGWERSDECRQLNFGGLIKASHDLIGGLVVVLTASLGAYESYINLAAIGYFPTVAKLLGLPH